MLRVVAAIVALALTGAPALACKCAVASYDSTVAETAVVFDGEVVRTELDVAGEREITSFRVRGVVKGLPRSIVRSFESVMKRTPLRTVTIVSRVSDAECGWDFREGPKRLIVGATRDRDGTLVATRCTIYNLNNTVLGTPR